MGPANVGERRYVNNSQQGHRGLIKAIVGNQNDRPRPAAFDGMEGLGSEINLVKSVKSRPRTPYNHFTLNQNGAKIAI